MEDHKKDRSKTFNDNSSYHGHNFYNKFSNFNANIGNDSSTVNTTPYWYKYDEYSNNSNNYNSNYQMKSNNNSNSGLFGNASSKLPKNNRIYIIFNITLALQDMKYNPANLFKK